ncbi:uncharacterized protein N7479_000844 [Penicillium vulpinum]|uniref:uncharacterized protein n=1 Tax=Penicillium vulpinum TaxID=29845 RepID=UPI002547F3DD|nr:uncharacterized protein N7479_000844 [Penicillium vulpinum]KAJ5970926.1 hypothetical protein N7479_000844 [Penicillium vulpinum]
MAASSECTVPVCSNSTSDTKVRTPMLHHRCLVCDAPIAKRRGKKFGLSQAKTVTSVTHLVRDRLEVLHITHEERDCICVNTFRI